jgi:hypothetical protein
MGVTLPWAILMTYQIYTKGVQHSKMPEPYYFIWGSAAMGVCAMLNMFDSRFGTVLAWGILIGAAVVNQSKKNQPTATASSTGA